MEKQDSQEGVAMLGGGPQRVVTGVGHMQRTSRHRSRKSSPPCVWPPLFISHRRGASLVSGCGEARAGPPEGLAVGEGRRVKPGLVHLFALFFYILSSMKENPPPRP